MSVAGALVCGFADEASQVAGVAWSIAGAQRRWSLSGRSSDTGASARERRAGRRGRPVQRRELGGARWDVELAARTSVDLGGGSAAALCEASISISGPGGDEQVDGPTAT